MLRNARELMELLLELLGGQERSLEAAALYMREQMGSSDYQAALSGVACPRSSRFSRTSSSSRAATTSCGRCKAALANKKKPSGGLEFLPRAK